MQDTPKQSSPTVRVPRRRIAWRRRIRPPLISPPLTSSAREVKPSSWRGYISYTMQGNAFNLKRFWAEGSGIEFRTVNLNHSMTSRPEHPEYLETYFDKKTNKTFTWNGKMWVDAMGNPAD